MLHLPFSDQKGWTSLGLARFLTVAGRTGFQPTRLDACAMVETDLHRTAIGRLSLWFTPLEDLGTVPHVSHVTSDPHALTFPLVSDNRPARDIESSCFGVFWSAFFHPKLLAKFCYGRLFPPMAFGHEPWVYAEHLPLHRAHWYRVDLVWNRPSRELFLYVNGRLIGFNKRADRFMEARSVLYVGNPMMAVSDFRIESELASAEQIRNDYESSCPGGQAEVDTEIDPLAAAMSDRVEDQQIRGVEWTEQLALEFDRTADLDGWIRQGPGYQPLPRCETTSEGLLIQTPYELGLDTRTYLWSPVCFEGDQWIEFDFRPESEEGLSLLVICASGTQREDYFKDHGVLRTGSMKTIIGDRLRNYHWEYFRRVEAIRTDCETQLLCKNPWERPLGYTAIPRLEVGRWYHLRLTKIGSRLRASIDARIVFDVEDSAFGGTGPVFDFGRIAFRQMYFTTMRYRRLTVHSRPSDHLSVNRIILPVDSKR